MQRKRNCPPLEEIGVTVEGMIPCTGVFSTVFYILALGGVAVLFLLQL